MNLTLLTTKRTVPLVYFSDIFSANTSVHSVFFPASVPQTIQKGCCIAVVKGVIGGYKAKHRELIVAHAVSGTNDFYHSEKERLTASINSNDYSNSFRN